MSIEDTRNSDTQGVWTGLRDWLRALDDSIHHDPSDALMKKVEQLEVRLAQIEAAKPGASS